MFWYRLPRRSVALSNRDQLSVDANEGCGYRHRLKLGIQLHGEYATTPIKHVLRLMVVSIQVVEITPIGIQTLHWKFYIIWTIFNASFVPIVYLFYPETADRTLEDIDRLFRENENIFVFKDKDAVSSKRPLAYIEHEQHMMRRNSSVVGGDPEAEKYRMEAIERVNKAQSDEGKGGRQSENV